MRLVYYKQESLGTYSFRALASTSSVENPESGHIPGSEPDQILKALDIRGRMDKVRHVSSGPYPVVAATLRTVDARYMTVRGQYCTSNS
jgi:hypothetical protein